MPAKGSATAAIMERRCTKPMKGSDLCAQVQENFGCGKSTAYTAIQKAEGKTIRKTKGNT